MLVTLTSFGARKPASSPGRVQLFVAVVANPLVGVAERSNTAHTAGSGDHHDAAGRRRQ